MVAEYGFREVWVPENEDLDEDYWGLPRSNIYMSPEFTRGFIGPKFESALILIQGTGAVRAGYGMNYC